MPKIHVNLSLEEDIAITLRQLAESRYTTMSQLVTDLILAAQDQEESTLLYRMPIADNYLDQL